MSGIGGPNENALPLELDQASAAEEPAKADFRDVASEVTVTNNAELSREAQPRQAEVGSQAESVQTETPQWETREVSGGRYSDLDQTHRDVAQESVASVEVNEVKQNPPVDVSPERIQRAEELANALGGREESSPDIGIAVSPATLVQSADAQSQDYTLLADTDQDALRYNERLSTLMESGRFDKRHDAVAELRNQDNAELVASNMQQQLSPGSSSPSSEVSDERAARAESLARATEEHQEQTQQQNLEMNRDVYEI
jgi:hypothetical protein